MSIFGGQRFLVYGNGISGKSALRAIRRNGGKAALYTDKDGQFTVPREREYAAAVISPGVKPTHPVYAYCKEHGIKTLSEAGLGFMLSDSKVIGVTGTNGKTTVTSLIAQMIGGVACGNIGYPITAAVSKKQPLVCELSSFQLYNNCYITPKIAVITNVASDHIDWHGSIDEYFRCKCNIASNMDGGYLVLGENIPLRALDTLKTRAEIVYCSTTRLVDGAYVKNGAFWFCGRRICEVDYLRLQGRHNIQNALCAIAAAELFGADSRQILSALAQSSVAPHRIAPVGKFMGKNWIDDSKGTNIAATLAAIESTHGSVCLITGGRDKGLDFSELFENLDPRVTSIVAMGESAQIIRDSGAKRGVSVDVANNLSDAVRISSGTSAETVLLSPACASFDEFHNYAERGEAFSAAVRALSSEKNSAQD